MNLQRIELDNRKCWLLHFNKSFYVAFSLFSLCKIVLFTKSRNAWVAKKLDNAINEYVDQQGRTLIDFLKKEIKKTGE